MTVCSAIGGSWQATESASVGGVRSSAAAKGMADRPGVLDAVREEACPEVSLHRHHILVLK
ncbi:MAG: hypothetical protein AAB363_01060 [Planctomycetota bacterium]